MNNTSTRGDYLLHELDPFSEPLSLSENASHEVQDDFGQYQMTRCVWSTDLSCYPHHNEDSAYDCWCSPVVHDYTNGRVILHRIEQ